MGHEGRLGPAEMFRLRSFVTLSHCQRFVGTIRLMSRHSIESGKPDVAMSEGQAWIACPRFGQRESLDDILRGRPVRRMKELSQRWSSRISNSQHMEFRVLLYAGDEEACEVLLSSCRTGYRSTRSLGWRLPTSRAEGPLHYDHDLHELPRRYHGPMRVVVSSDAEPSRAIAWNQVTNMQAPKSGCASETFEIQATNCWRLRCVC